MRVFSFAAIAALALFAIIIGRPVPVSAAVPSSPAAAEAIKKAVPKAIDAQYRYRRWHGRYWGPGWRRYPYGYGYRYRHYRHYRHCYWRWRHGRRVRICRY